MICTCTSATAIKEHKLNAQTVRTSILAPVRSRSRSHPFCCGVYLGFRSLSLSLTPCVPQPWRNQAEAVGRRHLGPFQAHPLAQGPTPAPTPVPALAPAPSLGPGPGPSHVPDLDRGRSPHLLLRLVVSVLAAQAPRLRRRGQFLSYPLDLIFRALVPLFSLNKYVYISDNHHQ